MYCGHFSAQKPPRLDSVLGPPGPLGPSVKEIFGVTDTTDIW